MAGVNWILKLGTHRSPYLHSQPPTSPLYLPNHTAERAYEIDRVLTVHMALCYSTAHSPQWAGARGGGPSDRGPVLPFRPRLVRREGFRHHSIMVEFEYVFPSSSLSLPDCCSASFFTKVIPPSSCLSPPERQYLNPHMALTWPRSISSFLKQADTFSTPSRSLYLMRKTSADIPAFLGVGCRFNNNLRDGNVIAFSVFLSLSLGRLLVLSVCLRFFLPVRSY